MLGVWSKACSRAAVVGPKRVALVPEAHDVTEAGVPEHVVDLAHGPVAVLLRVDAVLRRHQRCHRHVGCTTQRLVSVISRLFLVTRSHVSISACVKEDQLALCTRHGRTSAVFLRVFLIVISFSITSKIICVCL